jgi:hypothetical protein
MTCCGAEARKQGPRIAMADRPMLGYLRRDCSPATHQASGGRKAPVPALRACVGNPGRPCPCRSVEIDQSYPDKTRHGHRPDCDAPRPLPPNAACSGRRSDGRTGRNRSIRRRFALPGMVVVTTRQGPSPLLIGISGSSHSGASARDRMPVAAGLAGAALLGSPARPPRESRWYAGSACSGGRDAGSRVPASAGRRCAG